MSDVKYGITKISNSEDESRIEGCFVSLEILVRSSSKEHVGPVFVEKSE